MDRTMDKNVLFKLAGTRIKVATNNVWSIIRNMFVLMYKRRSHTRVNVVPA